MVQMCLVAISVIPTVNTDECARINVPVLLLQLAGLREAVDTSDETCLDDVVNATFNLVEVEPHDLLCRLR